MRRDPNNRMDTKRAMEELGLVVQFLFQNGYFVTGNIVLVDVSKSTCHKCGKKDLELVNDGKGWFVACNSCHAPQKIEKDGTTSPQKKMGPMPMPVGLGTKTPKQSDDYKICVNCGGFAYRKGSCYCCQDCGQTDGCS